MNSKSIWNQASRFAKEHPTEAALGGLALLPLLILPFFKAYRGWSIDAGNAGLFGDFIGGYFGTIILIASAVFISATYRNQKSTNIITSFESRFFELLRLHRDNVEEMKIGHEEGRGVFISLLQEFREALLIVAGSCISTENQLSQNDKASLAYLAIYYGVGANSSRMLREKTNGLFPENLVETLIHALENTQRAYRLTKIMAKFSTSAEQSHRIGTELSEITRLDYCPFDGHQSRVGHTHRHLYHLIKYIDEHAPEGRAREYADIVRAQLTNHEQAIFCLNILSPLGEAWTDPHHNFMQRYELIKNLPRTFFDRSEVDLEEHFSYISFEPATQAP